MQQRLTWDGCRKTPKPVPLVTRIPQYEIQLLQKRDILKKQTPFVLLYFTQECGSKKAEIEKQANAGSAWHLI